jgi:hypothetical protein
MYNCKVCDEEKDNSRKLSKHIRDCHKNFTIKEYYDKFEKKENDGICSVCGNETKYGGLIVGYKKTCGKNCAAKLHRQLLKNDTEKFKSFTEKISNCVKKEWSTKDQSKRIDKMKKTKKETINQLTPEERKEKFGFLNKLEDEERQKVIKRMTENGFLKWWKNASYEEKRKAWDKRNKKLVELWENCGEELHKKQKDTFVARLKDCHQMEDMMNEKMDIVFKKLDEFFGV